MLGIVNVIVFIASSALVSIFICYVNIFYFLDLYKYCFYNDAQVNQYDYIVVGAGTAGSIIAAKLSNEGQNTLLVEAGGQAPPFVDIPLLSPLLQQTPYDWQYITIPQKDACKALNNNQSRWPMGRILGGSSRLNYMTYVRGHPLDYSGWFPDAVEPIVDKGGTIHVENLKWSTILSDTILKAVVEMGLQVGNINEDLNIGFMKPQLTIKDSKRWSTDKILYQKFNNMLNIITHAHVNKILIKSNVALGIQFVKLGILYEAKAKKGVIISAGAVGSPKLLMLSGIGPKEHLEDLNIGVVMNLPVGQNLIDHILTGTDLVILNVSLPLSLTSAFDPASAFNYFLFGQGPWTSTGIEVVGTFHSPSQKNKSALPDLQLMVFPVGISKDYGIVCKKIMGISEKVYNQYFSPLTSENAVTIAPVLLHPKSCGEIKLQSSDPLAAPMINPKYLSHKDDISTLVNGLKFVRKLLKTNAMKALGASLYKKKFPGCENEVFDTTKYWECYVQHLTLSSYHPAGTCRIGDVVDTSFRVYGITKLYVVDASILPTLPSGNINAAVAMLAEKAVRLFQQEEAKKVQGLYNHYKSNIFTYVFHMYKNMCMI